jgi:nucleotide-binding universal stress UspA family protein
MISIKKILCPVDFSPASERAVRYATKLACTYNAKLKLLHVVSSFISPAYDFPVSASSVVASMEEGARRQLDQLIGRLGVLGIDVETVVRSGDISTIIEQEIQAYKPDLVAMGTHGRRGFERWIIGCTTERLLRRSPVPVLTLSAAGKNGGKDLQLRRILVTTDFSRGTADALDYAFSIAQENQAHITLLHVLEDARALTSQAYRQQLAKNVEQRLSKLIPPDARDWCDVDIRVEAGTPYHVILTMLKKEKVDLLVMNIHGISMVDRALLGATAERVLRAAICPVVLIPPMRRTARKPRARKLAA